MFAHNNAEIAYGEIALCNALMIRHHMPEAKVALITDKWTLEWMIENRSQQVVDKAFDDLIIIDVTEQARNSKERRFHDTLSTVKSARWLNFGRASAYDLSPYDETLLIDADYLIQSSSLSRVWGSSADIMISKDVTTLEHKSPEMPDRWLNPFGIAMYWATAVYFRKSPTAKILFDMVEHIRDQYQYYAYLYGFSPALFRNDYAFSIAVHTMNGSLPEGIEPLPINSILTSFDSDELISVTNRDELVFLVNDSAARYRFSVTKIDGINVHVMNKYSIVRNADRFVELYGSDL